jgi:ketosteroid isomerase-like protein
MTLQSSDLVEVAELVARYNDGFDNDDVDTFVDVFTPDGGFVTRSDGTITGHAALREWFATKEHNTIHVTTAPVVSEVGNEIRHRCTVLVFRRYEIGTVLSSVGHYTDLLTRTDSGLRFTRREPVTNPIVASDQVDSERT